MDDAASTAASTSALPAPPSAESHGSTPCLRTLGYCAECGTWDEHGAVCASCGYDFTGGAAGE